MAEPGVQLAAPALATAAVKATAPDFARQRAILEERARTLAHRPTSDDSGTEAALVVVQFRLADETVGLDCAAVREVTRLKGLTRLPRTPAFVLGVINLRGQVLSVVDLRRFLNLPVTELTESARVLVLSSGKLEFGLVVDAVLDIRSVPLNALQPAPQTVTGTGAAYLRGVTADGLSVLDSARLLNDPNLLVDEPDRRTLRGRTGEAS